MLIIDLNEEEGDIVFVAIEKVKKTSKSKKEEEQEKRKLKLCISCIIVGKEV